MRVNRKNDFAFKRIFGHEDSRDVLASFLSAVLAVPIEAEELTLIQTELSPEFVADKTSVLDIQVRRSKFHEKMNIEMQQHDKGNIEKRILQYSCKGYSSELKSGQDYSETPRYISIVIVDFDVFSWKNAAKFHGLFNMRDAEEGLLFSNALEIHMLELPKIRRQPPKDHWDALECWLHYLDNREGKVMEQVAAQEPMIRRAMAIEEAFMSNESERYLYELREKGRHDWDNAMITAEKRGEARGEKRGEVRGEKRGKQAGRIEGKVEVIRSMLSDGMAPDLISKFTGFSVEEIEALR